MLNVVLSVKENKSSKISPVGNFSEISGVSLQDKAIDLLQEAVNFISRYLLVFVAINSAEGCIRLELKDLSKNLTVSLDVELSLSDVSEQVSQAVLCL